MVSVLALVVIGCTPPPTTPSNPAGPPRIDSFTAHLTRAESPTIAVLRWQLTDGGNAPLQCRVDVDGDGNFDRVITPCRPIDTVMVPIGAAMSITSTLEVSGGGHVPVTRSITTKVAQGPTEPFDIDLVLPDGMRPEFREAFQDAAARWEQVIAVGVPNVEVEIPDQLFGWIPGYSGMVDDIRIVARDIPIDGLDGVLGRAGPVLVREGRYQPSFGLMEFDSADLDAVHDDGQLLDLVVHEMGHVLGLGGSWTSLGLLSGTSDPHYTGPAGVAAHQELGGSHFVPVEAGGGTGTALSHWRESVFEDELMTGYLGWAPGEPLSVISVASLADLGYAVDMGAADPYVLPSKRVTTWMAGARALFGAQGDSHREHLHSEPIVPFDGAIPDPAPTDY